MRHHARHFRFLVGRQDQPRVHIKEPAGQRHRVDHVGIDNFDRERNLRVGIAHQVLPDPVDVLRHHRIVDHLHLRLNLLGERAAHGHLFLDAVPVAHAASAAYVAVAHRIDVGLAAVVLDLAVFLHRQGRWGLLGSVLNVARLRLSVIRVGRRRCLLRRLARRILGLRSLRLRSLGPRLILRILSRRLRHHPRCCAKRRQRQRACQPSQLHRSTP